MRWPPCRCRRKRPRKPRIRSRRGRERARRNGGACIYNWTPLIAGGPVTWISVRTYTPSPPPYRPPIRGATWLLKSVSATGATGCVVPPAGWRPISQGPPRAPKPIESLIPRTLALDRVSGAIEAVERISPSPVGYYPGPSAIAPRRPPPRPPSGSAILPTNMPGVTSQRGGLCGGNCSYRWVPGDGKGQRNQYIQTTTRRPFPPSSPPPLPWTHWCLIGISGIGINTYCPPPCVDPITQCACDTTSIVDKLTGAVTWAITRVGQSTSGPSLVGPPQATMTFPVGTSLSFAVTLPPSAPTPALPPGGT